VRTLYIDIESAPNVAHVWGLWNQNVGLAQLRESGRVMCFAAKWRGGKRVEFRSEHQHGRGAMLSDAHAMLAQADVVAHFNGRRYDIPMLNREFVIEGMQPPAPFTQLDLLSVVKRQFRFPSNKLSHVSEALGIGSKLTNEGHMLWVRCLAGESKAWKEMERYNRQDVVLLESLHDRLMGWTGSQGGNARLYADGDVCPACGGNDLRREGHAYTATGAYQRFQCRSCGRWSRMGRRDHGTDLRGM
jgi:hypothetical protein